MAGQVVGRWRRRRCVASTGSSGERSDKVSSGDGSASTRRSLRRRRVLTAEIKPPSPTQVGRSSPGAVHRSRARLLSHALRRYGRSPLRVDCAAVDRRGLRPQVADDPSWVVAGPNGLVEKDTKTHASRRVALDDEVVAALTAHRDRQLHHLALAQVVASPSSFVFSDELDGATSWYPDWVSRRFRKLCETRSGDWGSPPRSAPLRRDTIAQRRRGRPNGCGSSWTSQRRYDAQRLCPRA